MPLYWFRCPDGELTEVDKCLSECRLRDRCMTLPTLKIISSEREWTGTASTTQLINGTMMEWLKLTQPYVVDPQSRVFMLLGIGTHSSLEDMAQELGIPAEVALTEGNKDIFDLLVPNDDGTWNLIDYKVWGSYKVALSLGIVVAGKQPDPSGDKYKTTGRWGKAGSPKMVPVFSRIPASADMWETELQLNRYRIKVEDLGVKIRDMQVEFIVRDSGLAVARGRGIDRGIYLAPVKKLDDDDVLGYFEAKENDLNEALESDCCEDPCDLKESWNGKRCKEYCDVAHLCPKGRLYLYGDIS